MSLTTDNGRREGKRKEKPKVAYRIDEFCDAFGVGRTKFYAELKAGRLKARRVGRRMIITAADAAAWLAALPSA